MDKKLDYDRIAKDYDCRFELDAPSKVMGQALVELAQRLDSPRILEVGCGTGHWLGQLGQASRMIYGVDRSAGMLTQARSKSVGAHLIQGDAVALPFEPGIFDLLYCVNAIHHFPDQRVFIKGAACVIRPYGYVAILGSDHFHKEDRWYVYDYFDGTRETDQERFMSWESLTEWLVEEGFEHVKKRKIGHISLSHRGQEVFKDPFLQKNSTSQLALLTDEVYQEGLGCIDAAIREAEERGEIALFETEISIFLLSGVNSGS